MKSYDLLSDIRKKDPYSQIRKATQEHHTSKNILNREFRWALHFQGDKLSILSEISLEFIEK